MSMITGWKAKKLTELADYINGYAFKPDDWGKEGLPIIRIEQLKNPDAPADYYDGKLPPSKIIENGDLIFSWSASLFLRIWRHGRAALNQHLFKVIERECVDRACLKAFIEFYLPALTAASHGSTMQHITRKELDRFAAPFPESKPEQTKIAEILSAIDRAIEQTEALVAKQQRIKTGLMQDLLNRGIDEHGNLRSERTHAFKDSALGRIPADWDAMSLGDVAEIIDPNPSHRYPPPCNTGVPIASTENFEADNEFDLTGCENVPRSVFEEQLRRCRYQPADVVFARKGRIGLARPYGSAEKVFSHTVVIIKTRETDRVVTEFLLWVVRDHEFFRQIDKRMNSNSGVPTLGVQFLAAIPILVPKPPEQQRIVQVMSQVEAAIKREQNSLRKLRSLKTALMQDLLTGRKRVTALLEPEPKREKIHA